MDNKLILCMGVRGAGKNTQINELLSRYSDAFGQALSCKTRDFRDGEFEGEDYYKLDKQTFQSDDAKEIFLETNNHFNHRYGTRNIDVQNILTNRKDCLKEMEPEGFSKIFKKRDSLSYAVQGIFMDIPNQHITSRMKSRGDNESEIQKALDRADFERQLAFLFSSVFGDSVLRFIDASKSKEEVFKECLRLLGVKSGLIQSIEDVYEKNLNAHIIPEYR